MRALLWSLQIYGKENKFNAARLIDLLGAYETFAVASRSVLARALLLLTMLCVPLRAHASLLLHVSPDINHPASDVLHCILLVVQCMSTCYGFPTQRLHTTRCQ